MWERAKVLFDRGPFCAVTRPLAGALLGAVGGGLYGALCGGLHGAVRATPQLFVSWLLVSAVAGTVTGFLMGACTAVDRLVCRADWEADAKRRPGAVSSANGRAVRVRLRVPRRAKVSSPKCNG